MFLTINEASERLIKNGFYRVANMVAIHHLLKEFADYDVTDARFYIRAAGEDFVHVALIQHDVAQLRSWEPYLELPPSTELQVRYTCAGDDLLYGLRTKFNSGGSVKPEEDLTEILNMVKDIPKKRNLAKIYTAVRGHPRYVRKRFRHGRTKAKVRAFIVMVKDKWASFWKF